MEGGETVRSLQNYDGEAWFLQEAAEHAESWVILVSHHSGF
jgi:hypothetical protein